MEHHSYPAAKLASDRYRTIDFYTKRFDLENEDKIGIKDKALTTISGAGGMISHLKSEIEQSELPLPTLQQW